MSVKLRSPVVVRKSRRRSRDPMEGSGCWETSVCDGDRLINEHGNRVSWWLVAVFAVVAMILVGVIMQHAHNTATTGGWSVLHASSWIQPTTNALASLVGITILLDLYTSYMIALKKGHLDRYVGQFLLSAFIKTALYIFYLYGLANYGTIGSFFAIITLMIMTAWNFMTSHYFSPLFAWIQALILAFQVFLTVFLTTSGAKVWPSA